MWCSVQLIRVSTVVLLLLQLPDYANTQDVQWEENNYGQWGFENKAFCSWKCLLFTLQWPGAFCQSLDNKTLCQIPQSINNWTIHGLWPLQVFGCCGCWPIFQSDIHELEDKLNEHWPSLLKIKSSFHFWREEWRKHGACAACVEGMNSPLRYFQICLKLREQFDIQTLLEAASITPSCDRLYKVEEVHQVLAPHLGDKFEIQCVTDEKERYKKKVQMCNIMTERRVLFMTGLMDERLVETHVNDLARYIAVKLL